jgi:hypothetical protein
MTGSTTSRGEVAKSAGPQGKKRTTASRVKRTGGRGRKPAAGRSVQRARHGSSRRAERKAMMQATDSHKLTRRGDSLVMAHTMLAAEIRRFEDWVARRSAANATASGSLIGLTRYAGAVVSLNIPLRVAGCLS